jgi:hypothetical protein
VKKNVGQSLSGTMVLSPRQKVATRNNSPLAWGMVITGP